MLVKCASCGSVSNGPPKTSGAICGVPGCYGIVRPFFLLPAILKCNICDNAFATPPRASGQTCGVNRCGGQLGRARL